MCFDSPDPPDYEPVADASEKAAEYGYMAAQDQLDFAREQADFTRQQYLEMKPLFKDIVSTQLGAMDQQMAMAEDAYNYQKNTFRPLEQEMVARAQEFNTDAYREGLAQRAKADTERAFANQDQALQRQMASMGVNPNSGAFTSSARQQDTQQAALQAKAMNDTRWRARAEGDAKLAGAAGLGRGMAPALSAYSGAMNAGNSAGQNAMAPGSQYMAGMGQVGGMMNNAYGTAQAGQRMQLQGLGDILSTQGSIYGMDLENQSEQMAGLGQLVGTLGSAAILSDRRLKENIVEVGTYPNGLPMYEFNYRGQPEERRYRGVMADDVAQRYPHAVVDVDGYQAVRYDALGIEMEAI